MNSKQLKILALIAMFFDHIVRIFPVNEVIAPFGDWLWTIGQSELSDWIMTWAPRISNYFGRIAAPVFMFCIVEGFLHTRSIKKYIIRVFGVALLAQIPYIMFFLSIDRLSGMDGNWQETSFNIMFTLGLGLLSLWGYRTCKEKGYTLLGIGVVALAAFLSWLLHFEGAEGYIVIIFMFYILRSRPAWQKLLLFIPVLMFARYRLIVYTFEDITLLQTCILNVFGPLLGILAICFYTGEKGSSGKLFQRFVYAFYPIHLLVLAIVGYVIPLA